MYYAHNTHCIYHKHVDQHSLFFLSMGKLDISSNLPMRKIPRELENPVDNVFLDVADGLLPILHRTGHTPNIITTHSFVLGLGSIHALHNDAVWRFCVMYMLSYFFDCVDGHFARHYKMTSKFGDQYDHFTDMAVPLGIFAVLYLKYASGKRQFGKTTVIAISIILFFAYMMLRQFGCQQLAFSELNKQKQRPQELLDNLQPLCISDDDIKFTRYFGAGTFNLVFVAIIASGML
jgi:phosphatidylglycerophosphate synthase